MMRSLELHHLTVDFRGVRAVDDVSATVHPGVTVLLGENGAGKTTRMRTLATLQIPTQGRSSSTASPWAPAAAAADPPSATCRRTSPGRR